MNSGFLEIPPWSASRVPFPLSFSVISVLLFALSMHFASVLSVLGVLSVKQLYVCSERAEELAPVVFAENQTT